jgi:hypothetical protein
MGPAGAGVAAGGDEGPRTGRLVSALGDPLVVVDVGRIPPTENVRIATTPTARRAAHQRRPFGRRNREPGRVTGQGRELRGS